jgi:hypothetical protein
MPTTSVTCRACCSRGGAFGWALTARWHQSASTGARYLGTRKNLFDLRRAAVVHNLHVIARQPATDSYQLAA